MGGYHGGGGVSTYTTLCGVVPGITIIFYSVNYFESEWTPPRHCLSPRPVSVP